MTKTKVILAVLIVAFLLFLSFAVLFYKPQFLLSFISTKKVNATAEISNSTNASDNLTLDRLNTLKTTTPTLFLRIREGINYHPGIILRVKPNSNGTDTYIVSIGSMEWDVLSLKFNDLKLGSPNAVCVYNLIPILDYKLKGVWMPQIPIGKPSNTNLLVNMDGRGNFSFSMFNGTCTGNGFIFNISGEFAGVCFGGKFTSASDLYNSVPKAKVVYRSTTFF